MQVEPAVRWGQPASLKNVGEWDVRFTNKAHELVRVAESTEGSVTLPARSVGTLVHGGRPGGSMR